MISPTITQAAQRVVDALAPVTTSGARVHPPPVPTSPPGGRSVLVGVPELVDHSPAPGGCGQVYDWRVDVLTVGADTLGAGLLDVVDTVLAAATDDGLRIVQVSPSVYDPPNAPAALPAALITLE